MGRMPSAPSPVLSHMVAGCILRTLCSPSPFFTLYLSFSLLHSSLLPFLPDLAPSDPLATSVTQDLVGVGDPLFPTCTDQCASPPPGVFSGKEAGGVLYCQQQQPGALVKEALLLLHWAEDHLLLLKAEHLAGTLNITTDWLSRQQLSKMEWQLHPEVFQS